ncbi:CRISPR-associated exonuclease, Cas4 family [Desulforamulus reducens MI-1]|uniref:CRISPR-associated exonuclease Cas4 n=1 Tax=Desulforamulus reducens (strain ATCC BAA-1160 / DSM 100696 / MI-1) TaxID=349161 RepID=A4J1Y1_DESRM|nr:CRISPR-associated exonuclease, Cas4 family [Desulforamulus reducens MI-1]
MEYVMVPVTGTLIWYYYICQREVWLIGHQITPDQSDSNISLGRYIHENSYDRERKELVIGHSKMDVFRVSNGELVVGEVKKSSKYSQSARMQLAFYLMELQDRGIKARGELRFPQEKKLEEVVLDENILEELGRASQAITQILSLQRPPEPKKINFCKNCAYAEFCWA